MISVLILTLQEEKNLPACLAALHWCDDVVVLDSCSTDRTVDIATAWGARVLTRPFDDFASQRNYGTRHGDFRHRWILHLDADEIVTPALWDEMRAAVPTTSYSAFRVASKMIFRGRWLRHSGMYPTFQVRLGERDELRFHQAGHGQRETIAAARLGTLREPLLHYSFSKGLADWIERHNRYSSAEALLAIKLRRGSPWEQARALLARDPVERRRAAKALASWLPCRSAMRFVYMYVLRRGFLDGSAGYSYCRLLAMYESMIALKIRELEREPS